MILYFSNKKEAKLLFAHNSPEGQAFLPNFKQNQKIGRGKKRSKRIKLLTTLTVALNVLCRPQE